MARTVVDVHVLDESASDAVLGKHALHHFDEQGVDAGLEVLVEALLHEHLRCGLALAAGIAGVAQVDAVGHLLAGEANLVGVDDDHVVAAFHVGRVGRLVFATQQFCHFGAQTTKNLVGCIDYHPLVLYRGSIGELGAVANGIHFLFL